MRSQVLWFDDGLGPPADDDDTNMATTSGRSHTTNTKSKTMHGGHHGKKNNSVAMINKGATSAASEALPMTLSRPQLGHRGTRPTRAVATFAGQWRSDPKLRGNNNRNFSAQTGSAAAALHPDVSRQGRSLPRGVYTAESIFHLHDGCLSLEHLQGARQRPPAPQTASAPHLTSPW